MRASYMQVDINAFKENIREIQKYVGDGITLMPVVKANCYGTYINFREDILNEFEIVAVAISEEGAVLRQSGYKNAIFCLNQPDITDFEEIVENNITIGLSSKEFLQDISNRKEKVNVHLEIETGMGRTGIAVSDLEDFIEEIKKANNITVEGIYTHFSVADTDEEYTRMQIEKFKKAVEIAENKLGKLKYIHTSASNGILNFKDSNFNLVRPGLIMYGYESFEGAKEKINLKPVAKLVSTINFLKKVEKGESVSYGRKFIADKDILVATVPLGYADGIRREYLEKGFVVINGKKAKIIGTICMDSFMVDVTDIPNVKVGSKAYIWDNEIITLDEIAKSLNTISYEILSTISNRVPRIFI